jgi:hypothetical protein
MPIELNLKKLEDMMSQLIHELTSIRKTENVKNENSQLSKNILIFSFFIFCIICVMSYVQISYVKKMIISKKNI